jgi:diketogulonate reductase-like aldo/keto reductase
MLSGSQTAAFLLAAFISIAAIGYDLSSAPDPPRTTVWLNSGYKMPLMGLGTWKSKPGDVKAAVMEAIDAGYRHIDCAHVYGNEKEVGEALNSSTVPRRELFITSKLWNTHHEPSRVMPAVKETLKNLRLKYLDLYLIHWPVGFEYQDNSTTFPKHENGSIKYDYTHFKDTWKTMEELVKKRLVRSIGVSNFNATQLQQIIDVATINPSVNQVESHPFLNQQDLLTACQSNNKIVLTAYSPLGSPDRPWSKKEDPSLLNDPRLAKIAATVGKTVAQVLLRFQVSS